MSKEKRFCLNCNQELSRRQTKYCSSSCQQEYQYKEYIERWKQGLEDGMSGDYSVSSHIRKYLHIKYNSKCCKCGWGETNPYTNSIPLEIEHIDGNYKNNKEENLQLICPNCHSLTPTYKGANSGKGRLGRKKYSQQYGPDPQMLEPNKATLAKIQKHLDPNTITKINQCPICGDKISESSKYCKSCRHKIQKEEAIKSREQQGITREFLKQEIRTKPFTQIAKEQGVSDNAIRKWCKKYNLPYKSSEIKQYTDKEWELI